MHFDHQQLRVFASLMTERSASRASLELHTSRSNVRRIWQNLEEQLGAPLFNSRDNGEAKPTPAAQCLEREMGSLLDEIRGFEAAVKKIHLNGRVLRLGADRSLFNTGHFGRLFNSLRHDSRFRVSFVEVNPRDSRQALESGACDLLFATDGPGGRRIESKALPLIGLDVASCRESAEGESFDPAALSKMNWAIAVLNDKVLANELLEKISKSGAGVGKIWSQQQFLNWGENPQGSDIEAVVCVRPVSFERMPRIQFSTLAADVNFGLRVCYLKQHPYEFLETTVGQIERALNQQADGLRLTMP